MIPSDVIRSIVGLAASGGTDRSGKLKSLRALADIQARAESIADSHNDRKLAALEIQQGLDDPRLSSATLATLPRAMSRGEDVFQLDPAAWSKGLGIGAQLGGIVVPRLMAGLLSPGAALALQLAGVLAEPTLTYLADRSAAGRDLSLGPILPPADDSQITALTADGFERILALAEKDPALKRFIDDGDATARLGFDVTQAPKQMVGSLPQNIQTAVAHVLDANPDNDPYVQKTLADELRKALAGGLERMEQKQKAIDDAVAIELGTRARARVLEELLRDLAFTTQELRGAISIGTTIIGTMLANAGAARSFQLGTSAIVDLYNAVGLFNLNKLGSLALAGTVVGAAGALLSAFAPGQQDYVAEALQQIDKRLSAISAQLDRIEQGQIEIQQQLRQLVAEVRLNADVARAKLADVSGSVALVLQDVNANARAAEQLTLRKTLDQLQSWLRRTPDHRRATEDEYSRHLTSIFSFATGVAKGPAFTGDPATVVDFRTARDLIESRPTADLMFGALPRLAGLVGVSVPAWPSPTGNDTIPNPLTWAEGVNAYLEARALAPEVQLADDPGWLACFWTEGLRIRDTLRAVSSYESIRAALGKLRAETGLDVPATQLAGSTTVLAVLQAVATRYEAEHFFPKYQLVAGDHYVRDGHTFYYQNDQTMLVRADPDPLDYAVKVGVLEKRATLVADWAGTQRRYECRLIINVGPDKGKLLLDKLLYEDAFDGGFQHGICRTWGPPSANATASSPIPLLDACWSLVRGGYDLVGLQANLPDLFNKTLAASQHVSFDSTGRIIQLLATIARWRQTPVTCEPLSTQIGSMPGLVTTERIVAHVGEFVRRLSPAETWWSSTLVDSLRAELQNDERRFVDLADATAPDASPLVLDETLRRLGGYMRARSVEIPLPVVRAKLSG